jgi:hypothetical protein
MRARPRILALTISIAASLAAAHDAGADETQDAAKHFERGVSLFSEADYKAALVEFQRAYALAPNTQVLFDIGETEFQLRDYASALTTFERFLVDAPPLDPQRADVEKNVDVLRTRVGHVRVETIPPGADVRVDDRPVGRTPLARTVLVTVGHREITATMPGRAPVSRWVDVAAEDDAAVTLEMPQPSAPPAAATPPARVAAAPASLPAPPPPARPHDDGGAATMRTLGWVGTTAFAAGAIAMGALAARESSRLRAARDAFPTQASALTHDASLTTTYSVLADSFGAAAVVLGGITLWATLTASRAGDVRVGVGPGSARLSVTF